MDNNKQQNTKSKCTCIEHDPYCCQIHGNCPVCVKPEDPEDVVLGYKTSLVAQTLDSKGNKQQTVVEWQFDQLSIENLLGIFTHDQLTRVMDILEQAKEMEKERMIGFTNKYINEELWVNCNAIESDSTVEQYYEKTYGGNK
jgi:predicted nucleic-acid-binding protein